MKDLHAEIGTT